MKAFKLFYLLNKRYNAEAAAYGKLDIEV